MVSFCGLFLWPPEQPPLFVVSFFPLVGSGFFGKKPLVKQPEPPASLAPSHPTPPVSLPKAPRRSPRRARGWQPRQVPPRALAFREAPGCFDSQGGEAGVKKSSLA